MKIVMKIISGVFHPLLLATYLSAILFHVAPELFPKVSRVLVPQFILVIFIVTCFMPALCIFLLRFLSYVSHLELTKRRERIKPFMFITFCYIVASYLFQVKLGMGIVFMTIFIGVSTLIFILLIITIWFKISIHATAIWSVVGFISALIVTLGIDMGWGYYALILVAGAVSTSRLYLGYHQPKEVWLGSFFGFLYSFFVIFFVN